ncbi:MAG: hypothetical protein LBN02_05210 [Oscillospiraceae bacterium]|jgi:hypothetical protein|nr:hypothetical protein [Oscillospiraceae bacterium]
MKTLKVIAVVAGAVLCVAGIVAVVVAYHNEISAFIDGVRLKVAERRNIALHPEEYADYADVEQ